MTFSGVKEPLPYETGASQDRTQKGLQGEAFSCASNPYVKIAAAALVVFALGSLLLGLHYAHSHAFVLKDIEDLPTSTLLEVDIPIISVFGVVGLDRGVISIRYHHWSEEKLLEPRYEDEETFVQSDLENPMRFTVLTSERGSAAPRGVFEVAYEQLQAVAGSLISLARWRSIDLKKLEHARNQLGEKGYEIEEVTLQRDRVSYQGFLVRKKDGSQQERWAIQALGISGYAQKSLLSMGEAYGEVGFNLLIVNPPGVGKSQGRTTGKTLGQAQETGLRFLEHRGAKKIILAGFSLGGGMMGSAVVQHQFRKEVQYLGLFQMTFSSLSKTAASIIRGGVKGFSKLVPLGPFPSYCLGAVAGLGVRSLGMEMDSVAAVRRLVDHRIPVILVQKSSKKEAGWKDFDDMEFASDGIVFEKVCLGKGVQEAGMKKTDQIFAYNPSTEGGFIIHDRSPQDIIVDPLKTVQEYLPQDTHAHFFSSSL